VHAVAVEGGAVVAAAGDPELVTHFRSSAKPLQALPLVRARPDVADDELALASASHAGAEEQVAVVRRLLERSGSTEDDLECGPQEGRPPRRIYHNCSGKHAGMLATCRARGWPIEGYRLAGHPLQNEILHEIMEAAETEDIATAVDGCGVVCFALPLERVAFMFGGLARRSGGERVVAAMQAYPRLVGGAGQVDTDLMEALPGWIAKGGAEGLLAAAGPDGTGIALKTADGSFRALRVALPLVLDQLPRAFGRSPVKNSRGEEVGELVATS
jgi:L-asparaginase II